MAKRYSFERGKYGFTTGTIIPFARFIDGVDPVGNDFLNYVPAGFLKCDGTIYNARDFYSLATVIGVGSECRFTKEGTVLVDANEGFRNGQFQVPDLGSKFISAASANGVYNNLFVENPNTGQLVERVGIEGSLELNQGEEIITTYTGSFQTPIIPVEFSPNARFGTTLRTGIDNATLSDNGMLAHAHFSNAAAIRSGPFEDTVCTDADPIDDNEEGLFSNQEETVTAVGGLRGGTEHGHQLARSSVTTNVSSNIDSIPISGELIQTTTTISKSNAFKFDDIQHRFMLVVYLIKT